MASSKGSTAELDCVICTRDSTTTIPNRVSKGSLCTVVAVVEVCLSVILYHIFEYICILCLYVCISVIIFECLYAICIHLYVLVYYKVKRNVDDIGEAFLGYQRSLTWLAGKEVAV